jgi:hypothetical protein
MTSPTASPAPDLDGLEGLEGLERSPAAIPHWHRYVRLAMLGTLVVVSATLGGVFALSAQHLLAPETPVPRPVVGLPVAPARAAPACHAANAGTELAIAPPYLEGAIVVTNHSGRRVFDGCVRLSVSVPGVGEVGCANAPGGASTWRVHLLPQDARSVVEGKAQPWVRLTCRVPGLPRTARIPAHAFAGSWPDRWPGEDAGVVHVDNAAAFVWRR